MILRRSSIVLGAAAVFIAVQVFILVLIPRKAGLDHPAAVLAQDSRRPLEKSDGCPDQPTFMRLASWKEWDRYIISCMSEPPTSSFPCLFVCTLYLTLLSYAHALKQL